MADDDSIVLSDVDDEDPSPIPIAIDQNQQLIRDLRSQLKAERSARQRSDETLRVKDDTITRLRAFAHDCIKKHDDALKEKDDTFAKLADSIKQNEQISKQLADKFREKEEISKQKVGLKSEMDMAAQLMATGINKISGKVSNFNNFAAVAYGAIKRANEIVEDLMKQVDGAAKSRDQVREQNEQRNYKNAIEVSQLDATISGLRDEVSKKGGEIERLERLVGERDAKISEMEREVSELRQFGKERDVKLSNVSKAYDQLNTIVRIADGRLLDQSSDLSFD